MMQVKIFNIPIPGGDEMTEEMNRFLRSKKILETESELVSVGKRVFWCFCIKYLEEGKKAFVKRAKIDYKAVLDAESYKRFVIMKSIRMKLSKEEGIPAYTVFTNEELASLAKLEELTQVNMKKIKGIGEKKVEKYGQHFIAKKENEANKLPY